MTVLTANPFHNTGPIENAHQFFNRKGMINHILTRLFTEENQPNISVIGLRKSGKSSLIKHLMRPETIAEYGYDGGKYLFVYVDCGRFSTNMAHTAAFYRLLYQLVLESLMERAPSVEQELAHGAEIDTHDPFYRQSEWEALLKLLKRQAFSLVVLLDQFDIAVMQGNLLREGLFGSFRVYGGSSNFSWITCTYQPLPSLFASAFETYGIPEARRRSESDFFNQFTTNSFYYMGLFEPAEIEQIMTLPLQERQGFTRLEIEQAMTLPLQGKLEFTRSEIRAIRRFGGRFPYFIQRICSHFYQAHLEGMDSVEAVVQTCLQEAAALWDGYWDRLEFQQKIVLYSLASQHPVDHESMVVSIMNLQNIGLIYEEDGHYFPFSEEFRRYIIRNKQDFAPGQPVNEDQELWGQYRVESIAGRTLHSQVVKAQDIHLTKRHWAIKLLCINPAITPLEVQQLREQLMREARILDSLEHPNIGQVHNIKHDVPALIMPWIEGEPLDKLLMRKKQEGEPPFSALETINIALQLASALEHAHQRNIVHRDIKPNNIIMSYTSGSRLMPVLIDFDVAHAKDQHTVTRTADGLFVWVGNEDYAAPERFLDFTYSEAPMDIFSLGVVLYEMLTYQRPYPSYSRHSVLHYGDSLSSPLREDIPDPLYRLLRAMLQFEPQERPDAGAVIACLQDCLRQLTVARTLPEEQISAEERNFWLTRVYVRIGKILERIMHHEKP